jgi:hypothetical protein
MVMVRELQGVQLGADEDVVHCHLERRCFTNLSNHNCSGNSLTKHALPLAFESPSNFSPNPLEVIPKVSERYDNFAKYPPCPSDWNPNIFVSLGAHAKFQNPRQPLLGF